ncbi:MAG: hypothetical protein GEU83_02960 [Pseudonocardiaceae bacterium]|nr:hypothetical protein [Pseudonocardiaceae bacterium]
MSVDTNVKGKNLAPYRRAATGTDLEVLVAPKLVGLASQLHIAVKGVLLRRLVVELSGSQGHDDGCAI